MDFSSSTIWEQSSTSCIRFQRMFLFMSRRLHPLAKQPRSVIVIVGPRQIKKYWPRCVENSHQIFNSTPHNTCQPNPEQNSHFSCRSRGLLKKPSLYTGDKYKFRVESSPIIRQSRSRRSWKGSSRLVEQRRNTVCPVVSIVSGVGPFFTVDQLTTVESSDGTVRRAN